MHSISAQNEKKIGIILSYITMAVGIAIALFYTPLKLRYLGGSAENADVQYGLNSFTDSLTSWLTIISAAASASYIRFATIKQKEEGDEGLKEVSSLYLLIYLGCMIIADAIGLILYVLFRNGIIPLTGYTEEQQNIIYDLILLSLLSVSLGLIATVADNFLNLHQKFIFIRLSELISTVAIPLISLPFLFKGCNVQTLVIIIIVIQIPIYVGKILYSVIFLKQRFTFRFGLATKLLAKEVFVFSFYLVINAIVDQISSQIDKTILGFMAPPELVEGPSQVTIYTLGQTFVSYVGTASIAIQSVFVPDVNRLVANGDQKGLNDLFLKVSRVQMIVMFTIVGGFWCCGYDFVIAWVGEEKIGAFWIAAAWMSLCLVPYSENLGIEAQRAMNKHKFRTYVYFAAALANVGVSILLVYLIPKNYAAYATMLGTIITTIPSMWVIINWYYKKRMGLPINKWLRCFLVFLIATGVAASLSFATYLLLPSNYSWRWSAAVIKGAIFLFYQFLGMLIINRELLKPLFIKIFKKWHDPKQANNDPTICQKNETKESETGISKNYEKK